MDIRPDHAPCRTSLPVFAGDESGGAIVLGLVFFTLMIMMGGLAVDLMRFEHTRTTLQQTTDRAVLAAAAMSQQLDPEAVVQDYFLKAGLADHLKSVDVVENFNSKSVEITASSVVDPFFMQMLGINELEAPAASRAEERITDVEISLVLDISGSMDSSNRLINLKPAASEFVDTIFAGAEPGRTTISIIPYSGHVNLGSTLASVFPYTPIQADSYCMDLPSSTFSSTTVSLSTPLIQASHFDPFASSGTRTPSLFFCPPLAANTVLPLSDSPTALKARINGLNADGLIVVGAVAGDAHGPKQLALGAADHHPAYAGHELACRCRGQGVQEVRSVAGHDLLHEARGVAQGHAAPGLAKGDLKAQGAACVLSLGGHQVAAAVDHATGQRQQLALARQRQGRLDDLVGLGQGDALGRCVHGCFFKNSVVNRRPGRRCPGSLAARARPASCGRRRGCRTPGPLGWRHAPPASRVDRWPGPSRCCWG